MPPTSSALVSTSKIAASTSEPSNGARASESTSGGNIPGGRGYRRIRLFPEDLVGAALDRGAHLPQVLVHEAVKADDRLTSAVVSPGVVERRFATSLDAEPERRYKGAQYRWVFRPACVAAVVVAGSPRAPAPMVWLRARRRSHRDLDSEPTDDQKAREAHASRAFCFLAARKSVDHMELMPLFLNLNGRAVVLVGGGRV